MKRQDDAASLKHLGSNKTDYKYDTPSVDILESFMNQFPDRDYIITLGFDEFTSLCPKTGQPDFGKITIEYIPDTLCIESKSLKLYLFSFRQTGTFMETIVNNILSDCVEACSPRKMVVIGEFAARGGIKNIVTAEFEKKI